MVPREHSARSGDFSCQASRTGSSQSPSFYLCSWTTLDDHAFYVQNGSFLVRTSNKPGQPFTLVVMFAGVAKNIPIRKRDVDRRFALGTPKDNEAVSNALT